MRGSGRCCISLYKDRESLVIYRVDKNDNPILNNEDVLIIEVDSDSPFHRADICVSVENYKFIRQSLLLKPYDSKKTELSIGQWIELKRIFSNRTLNLEGITENV